MIELKNLCIGYDKDTPIINNINYTFEDNKIYGVLGPSGYGKTTLLRTIAGLLRPISGQVLIDGKPFRNPREDEIYMMFQNYTSFDWVTCTDNVLVAKSIRSGITDKDRQNAKNILESVGLGDKLDWYPRKLSGGQKQRLALARSLFMSPKAILMDEPLSALDEITRSDMQNLILNDHTNDKNIIIMITHSSEEAKKMCDVIIDITKEKGFGN
jgi:ABC-type nitrate/sulfonate/bicarbonate transport system ATPase subunit